MSISNVNATQVYIDGVYQSKSNYTTSGNVLTFTTTAPATGTSIEVVHIKAVNATSINQNNFTGNGNQTFTLSQSIDDSAKTFVFIQGVYQEKSTYAISGNQITFTTAPQTGFSVEVMAFNSITVGNQNAGIDWQSAIKTANFTADSGKGYFVNTTSGGVTVTLPSSPSSGDEVSIVDYAGTADTNAITLTSSNNIKGLSENHKITRERAGVSLVYSDATQGWLAYNSANEGTLSLSQVFTQYNVSYLLVGGGGGGGGYGQAGGGGAGGLLENSFSSLAVGTVLNITIGSGGAGGSGSAGVTDASKGANGGLSSISGTGISTIQALGGGYGHGHSFNGGNGGSGGGSGTNGTGGTGTSGQGNDGGTAGSYLAPYSGSGGGGAGAAGAAGGNNSGNGGIGVTTTIIGAVNASAAQVGEISSGNVYFAGGGGGGTYQGTAGTGGLGGASDGFSGSGSSSASGTASNATPNTGGGGGGAGNYSGSSDGGNGGSGVCILKFPLAAYSGTTTGSPLEYEENNFKILVFKQNGSYTV